MSGVVRFGLSGLCSCCSSGRFFGLGWLRSTFACIGKLKTQWPKCLGSPSPDRLRVSSPGINSRVRWVGHCSTANLLVIDVAFLGAMVLKKSFHDISYMYFSVSWFHTVHFLTVEAQPLGGGK